MAKVVTTPLASDDITRIDAWWRDHRHSAPDLFIEELAEIFDLLASAPDLGHRYRSRRVRSVRRILLRATRYHVYYTHESDRITVLAVWSSVRGRGPVLRGPGRPPGA